MFDFKSVFDRITAIQAWNWKVLPLANLKVPYALFPKLTRKNGCKVMRKRLSRDGRQF